MNDTLTLYQLNALVRNAIEEYLNGEYWVEAELSECRESHGHCYMELVQKDVLGNTPVARAAAKCWRTQWTRLQPLFIQTTGQPLHAGMKVRLKVYAQFHEAYGFSWIVSDIDPTFTMGDMAQRRQQIINQLKEEGIFDLQKELELPMFCQNIAVISSETAAGYGDFCRQLDESPFAFHVELFPAIMQGEQVEESIIRALEHIYEAHQTSTFDCVVIIRGGGATADMSGFDSKPLAENVAQFPLPIITGIGHDRDECILDMVSHIRVKTPTAAAALLIDNLQTVLNAIDDAQNRITRYSTGTLAVLGSQLSAIASMLPALFETVKTRQNARLDLIFRRIAAIMQQRVISQQGQLDNYQQRFHMQAERCITKHRHNLQLAEETISNLDPNRLLKKGYSITLKDGKAIKTAVGLKKGDEIETRLYQGIIKSTIK
jgi:exodeoxyribonuclease VII large subunit